MLAVAGGFRVDIWDLKEGRLLQTIDNTYCRCLCFSRDSKQLAIGGRKREGSSTIPGVHVWDVKAESRLKFLPSETLILSLAFSRDGKRVVAGAQTQGQTGLVHVWDIHGDSTKPLETFKGHSAPVRDVAFAGDDKLVLSASTDRTVKQWDLAAKKPPTSIRLSPIRHPGCFAVSQDGKTLAVGQVDFQNPGIHLWNLETGESLGELSGHKLTSSCLTFSTDGKFLAHGGLAGIDRSTRRNKFGELVVWDVQSKKPLEIETPGGPVRAVAFTAGGQELIAAMDGKPPTIWNVNTGESIGELEGPSARSRSLAISVDGKTLATIPASQQTGQLVVVWDMETRQPRATISGSSDGGSRVVSVSADGQIVAATVGNAIRIWSARDGRLLAECQGHSSLIRSLAFDPLGRTLVSRSRDQTMRFWDVATGEQKAIFEIAPASRTADPVAFPSDGSFLATFAADYGSLRLWRAAGKDSMASPSE